MATPTSPSGFGHPSSRAELAARLNELSIEFGDSLSGRVKEVRRIWSLFPAAPLAAESRDALVKIHDIVHVMAGSGKSFGFPLVSLAAAPLDGLFRLLREQNQTLSPEEVAQIEMLVQGLERAIQQPRVAMAMGDLAIESLAAAHPGETRVLILATSPHDTAAASLRDAVKAYGLACDVIEGPDSIPADVTAGRGAIVVADISMGDRHLETVRGASALTAQPLVLTSRQAGFADRLRAVRLGATLFLAHPFDVEELVAHIGSLEEARSQRPYRVVIVDDETILATFYNLTLGHAGMDTRVVNAPSKLLDTLSGFDPDLILMDLYMPECSGLELAQIVRQFPAYTTVPILFLSTESRLDLQLKARHLDGDDFLQKPLQPGQLISAVTSRANRYRDLKKLTDRDSLTGLLNHSNILRTLDRELIAAGRTKTPLSVAMVDIDHFKSINDTYGHAVGDQVISRVTHVLRNRLRRTDYVGRYGGEEFAVVMPTTDAAAAKAVLDQLREASNSIEHRSGDQQFTVTFSAGVAAFPAVSEASKLVEAADAALYKAKRDGRNRVVVG